MAGPALGTFIVWASFVHVLPGVAATVASVFVEESQRPIALVHGLAPGEDLHKRSVSGWRPSPFRLDSRSSSPNLPPSRKPNGPIRFIASHFCEVVIALHRPVVKLVGPKPCTPVRHRGATASPSQPLPPPARTGIIAPARHPPVASCPIPTPLPTSPPGVWPATRTPRPRSFACTPNGWPGSPRVGCTADWPAALIPRT